MYLFQRQLEANRNATQLSEATLRGRLGYIFGLVVLIHLVYPVTLSGSLLALLGYQALYVLLIISGLLILQQAPAVMRLLMVSGMVWLIVGPLYAVYPNPYTQLGAYISIGIFQALVCQALLQFVFSAHVVDRDVLFAACAVYLVVGGMFMALYGTVETINYEFLGGDHTFSDPRVGAGERFPWQNLIYFSFTTLTTAGYGDIVPTVPVTRALANLEAIAGVLYTTIIVARLVSLYSRPDAPRDLL